VPDEKRKRHGSTRDRPMTVLSAAAATKTVSGNELVFAFALLSLFALLGYRISAIHRVLRGVTPWRFPSFVWAAICFAFGPIGLVVELFAEFTTKPRLPSSLGRLAFRDPATRQATNTRIPGVAMAPTMPATVAPQIGVDVEPIYRGPALPKDEAGRTALFGWYADPLGRHELRYFDGRRWADFVADGGVRSADPLENK
jgi:hypothetical protein